MTESRGRLSQRLRNRVSVSGITNLRRRVWVAFGVVFLLAVFAACDSTNTYPIDYFSEMHYQKSWRSFEPPRLAGPDGAVPIDGRAPLFSRQEAVEVENPLEASDETAARGEELFSVNCQACHGPTGEGNGPISSYFQQAGVNPPANLTEQRLQDVPDGYIYSVVEFGFGNMPPFGNLIQGDDIWAIVTYIRQLQAQAGE